MNPAVNAMTFLISSVFSIYILLVMLRFLIQWMRIGFRDAPAQFVKKVTDIPLQFLYNLSIPAWRGIDFSAVLLMLVLEFIKNMLIFSLHNQSFSMLGMLLFSVFNLIVLGLYIFVFTIIIESLLSWVTPPDSYNPLQEFLYRFNDVLLRPARQLIPPFEGIDLSPMVVLLGLWVMIILLNG